MSDLRFFVFERSEDGFGQTSWEGVASVREADLSQARAELDRLLGALDACAPGPRAPMEEGGVWDWSLDERVEGAWHSLHLCVNGPSGWAEEWLAEADQ